MQRRILVPNFKNKIDHIINTHPQFGFEKGKGGYQGLAEYIGLTKSVFSYLVEGRAGIDKPYESGELFYHQIEKICKNLPIEEETLREADFETFKLKWNSKIPVYDIKEWELILAAQPDSDDICLFKEASRGFQSIESLVPTFRARIDSICIEINCPVNWFLAIVVFSENVGWESIQKYYQPDNPITALPVVIPDPNKPPKPITVTGIGPQCIVAVASKQSFPEAIMMNIANENSVGRGMADLLAYSRELDVDEYTFMVKRFEVIS